MSRKALALSAAFAMFGAITLVAGPIDPQGPDYPDIGTDNLALQATAPICFDDGDTYCLNNLLITATGAVADSTSGANEIDTFPSQLSGDLFDMTTNTDLGDWLVPYDGSGGTVLDVRGRADEINGQYADDFDSFDFAGNLPVLGSFEIEQDGAPDTNGQTTFSGPNADVLYNITSFFDVFTEISLDGGNTFITPNNDSVPTEFDVVAPEPGTFLLLLPAAMLLAYYRSRYKRACAPAISRQS